VKVTSKGQITIPQRFRQKHGLLPLSEVDFIEHKDGLMLVKSAKSNRGRRILAAMMEGGKVKGSTARLLRLTRGP
jgi:AbrB family looped-hinge helix DNA binding protein